MISQICSIIGAFIVLLAYIGHQLGVQFFDTEKYPYNIFNFIASIFLVYAAFYPIQFGFIVMEFAWGTVSLYKVFCIFKERNWVHPILYHSKDVEKHIKIKRKFTYVARVGLSFDGHSLAEKVLHSGNHFIGEVSGIKKFYPNNYTQILKNPLMRSVECANTELNRLISKQFKITPEAYKTIGTTGTNGKTSVTQISSKLIENLSQKTSLRIGTLGLQYGEKILTGSHVTTPDYPSFLETLNLLKSEQHFTKENPLNIFLEYTSHALKENRLSDWPIDVAVFTNLTQDHLDYHLSMEDYKLSKQILFKSHLKSNGFAVININSDVSEDFILASTGPERKLIAVGDIIKKQEILLKFQKFFRDIIFLDIRNRKSNLTGLSGEIYLEIPKQNKIETFPFHCPLLGEFQFENLLCSLGIAIALNHPLKSAAEKTSLFNPIPGRLEKISLELKKTREHELPIVLVDYAHTPDALKNALETCRKMLSKENKLIVVFGCGGDRDKTKRPLMGRIAFDLADVCFVTSDNPRTENPQEIINQIFDGNHENQYRKKEVDRKKAIETAINSAVPGDLVIIAGKGHENYQIIGTEKHPFSDSLVVQSALKQYLSLGDQNKS